jgi:hypothetical protein
MHMYGADPVALDQLAAKFDGAAQSLRTCRASINHELDASPWAGPDAENFRGVWSGMGRRVLESTAAELERVCQQLHTQASQQRTASSPDGDVGGGVGAIGSLFEGKHGPGNSHGPEPAPWSDSMPFLAFLPPILWPALDIHPPTLANYSDPLFQGNPSPNDVRQGALGDCYFAAPAAALAQKDPDAIRRLVSDNHDGTYTVSFHNPDGSIHAETVDGELWSQNGDPIYGQFHNNDAWFPIVEKAYAKWKGSYDAIGNGGQPADALQALTGAPTHSQSIHSGLPLGIGNMSNDEVWNQLQSTIGSHHLMTATTSGLSQNIQDNGGVVNDHAYTVLGAGTNPDGSRYVTVRNPWGSTPGDNGVGTMSLSDFCKYYSGIQWTS